MEINELRQPTWEKLTFPVREAIEPHFPELKTLVHFTNFSALKSMLEGNEVWFSCVSNMSDVSEAIAGKRLLQELSQREGDPLREIFKSIRERHPAIVAPVDSIFKTQLVADAYDTFVSCWANLDVSKGAHDDLTMWRGYGGDGNGVAIAVNPVPMQLYSMPYSEITFWKVHYESIDAFHSRAVRLFSKFAEILEGLSADEMQLEPEFYAEAFNELVYYLALTHKHPFFSSESEWRFVWRRHRNTSELHDLIKAQVIPRGMFEFFCFKMEDNPDLSSGTLRWPAIVQEIMIGPTNQQVHKAHAVLTLLRSLNFDPELTRVTQSQIPYRNQR